MQFKKGAAERRAPQFKRHESDMESQASEPATEEDRSNYGYSRPTGGEPSEETRAPEGPRTQARASRVESLVDSSAVVEGHFQADNDLRIQGTITGEITCRGILTIEQNAVSKARINTQECEVFGTVDGDITCSGRMRLASTAVVTATMRAGSLVVEEGASITGSIETNYSGEVTSAAATRRRTGRKDDDDASGADDDSSPRVARRDAPSFALVSSDESATGRREGRSS